MLALLHDQPQSPDDGITISACAGKLLDFSVECIFVVCPLTLHLHLVCSFAMHHLVVPRSSLYCVTSCSQTHSILDTRMASKTLHYVHLRSTTGLSTERSTLACCCPVMVWLCLASPLSLIM